MFVINVTNETIMNVRIHFRCKMPIWFQKFLKYQQRKYKKNLKKHKFESLLLIKYKHLLQA